MRRALLIAAARSSTRPTAARRRSTSLIDDGRIARVGPTGPIDADARDRSTRAGCWSLPGLIDMHVHLREPGQEYKETIATGDARGGRRRLHGGRVHAEHQAGQRQRARVTEFILERAAAAHLARVYPIGARVARARRASSWPRSASCTRAGSVAVSDDGRPVMRRRC